MLSINQLVGFGATHIEQSAAGAYRYLRLVVNAENAPRPRIGDVRWTAGGVDYPTVNMTSNTAPSPLIASAQSAVSGYEAYKAFDNSPGSEWALNTTTFPGWLQIDLGVGNEILPIGIGITPYTTFWPTDFNCYGSNTGAFAGEETLLYASGSVTTGWTSSTRRNFVF